MSGLVPRAIARPWGAESLWVAGLSRAQASLGQLRRGAASAARAHQAPVTSSSEASGPLATLADADRNLRRLGFLSWSSSKIAPLPVSPRASTLGCPRFGVATSEHVPPLSFLPTSAASSAHGFAGLLHPASSYGVRLVSSRLPTFADDRPSSEAFLPPRSSPQDQRVCLSPGPLPPRRWCAATEATATSTSRLSSDPEFHTPRVTTPRARAPWGSLDPSFH
jgi:hypothetical protein